MRRLLTIFGAPLPEGVGGAFREEDGTIWLDHAQAADPEVTLLHEVAHYLLASRGCTWAGHEALEDELTRLAEEMVLGLNSLPGAAQA